MTRIQASMLRAPLFRPPVLRVTVAALLACAVSPPAMSHADPTARGQEEEVEDKREDIKELLKELAAHVKKRGEEDEQAIALIDRLYQEFPACGPKDRTSIVKELEDCLDVKRTKELEEGVPDDRLFLASAVALGDMGPESVKALVGQIGNKRHKENHRLLRAMILSLGKTGDPGAVQPLLKLLDHKDDEVLAASAEALAEFQGAELEVRKEIFEELLKILMGQKSRIDTDTTDSTARERWNAISGPIISTLQKLSGHQERDPHAWQSWWNDNKKADWDGEG